MSDTISRYTTTLEQANYHPAQEFFYRLVYSKGFLLLPAGKDTQQKREKM